jgi:alpha-glucosidase
MNWISRALLVVAMVFPAVARAQMRRLGDFALTGSSLDGGVFTVRSAGPTVQLSFITPTMARVRIAPSGDLAPNPSVSVDGLHPPLTDTRVVDRGSYLLVQNVGLSLRIDKQHLRVDAYDASNQQPISLESPADGVTWDDATGAVSASRVLDPAEHLYGLGQDNANHGMLDRRGSEREMWTGQQIRSGNVTASYPVPFYLSTGIAGRGYGCFVDNPWHLNFDLGKAQPDRLSWTAPGGGVDYYLINGPSFASIIDQYTQLTGRPSMLPVWALGFWQSRCFFQSFADIDHSVTRLQHDGVPIDVAVVDSAWSQKDMDFKWSDQFLGDRTAADWIAEFHRRGLHVILSTKGPMIKADSDNYADAMAHGLFATDGHGQPMVAGYYGGDLMDVTSPNFAPWLATQLRPLTRDGIDGWWLDLNEPEGEPPQAVYHAGKSADIHNTFSTRNNKAYYDYCRDDAHEDRPVILGRAATAGTQRYSGIVWTGDINSDWPTFQAHLPELQNAGMSGLPYWTNDSGGFLSGFLHNDRYGAHAELYQRWFEFTCFAPIARAHKAGPSEPYEFGPAVEATAKHYLQLRYRLMPYLYTAMHTAATTGLPIDRALVLADQNDAGSQTARNEFLFGPDILVAPVIEPGATACSVYFPPGQWIGLEDGFAYPGGQTTVVAAPRDKLPLFVRAGAILPEAPPMTDTEQKPWDPLTLEVWPDRAAAATLYQDDEHSADYARGQFTTTTIRCTQAASGQLTLSIAPSNALFGPQTWNARLHLTRVPAGVMLDGRALAAPADWSWDEAAATLSARIAGEHAAHTVVVTLTDQTRPRPVPPHLELQATTLASSDEPPRQIAQFLPPPKLPIRIEAANFDKGGEGLAYHVASSGNPGGLYRQEGVPIIASTDAGGGYAIPSLNPGDWLAYTVDAGPGGRFTVSARVLPGTSEGTLSLLSGRTRVLTTMDIPASPAASPAWIDAAGASAFTLPPGEQILTFRVENGAFQLGHFTFSADGAAH